MNFDPMALAVKHNPPQHQLTEWMEVEHSHLPNLIPAGCIIQSVQYRGRLAGEEWYTGLLFEPKGDTLVRKQVTSWSWDDLTLKGCDISRFNSVAYP